MLNFVAIKFRLDLQFQNQKKTPKICACGMLSGDGTDNGKIKFNHFIVCGQFLGGNGRFSNSTAQHWNLGANEIINANWSKMNGHFFSQRFVCLFMFEFVDPIRLTFTRHSCVYLFTINRSFAWASVLSQSEHENIRFGTRGQAQQKKLHWCNLPLNFLFK